MSDPSARAALNKSALRRQLRHRRGQLSAGEQHIASQALTHSVEQLPAWQSASSIALYLPADGEIDPTGIAKLARLQGKVVFLPVIRENSLDFALWEAGSELVSNQFGIKEPADDAPRAAPGKLDIIGLPLVAWDSSGGRLGMGGGYYDRTLAHERSGILLGLAHEIQQLDSVPCDAWDVKLDYVATAAALYECSA